MADSPEVLSLWKLISKSLGTEAGLHWVMAARKPTDSRMPRKIMPNASPVMSPAGMKEVVKEEGRGKGKGNSLGMFVKERECLVFR
ncbi:hypothetical protein E2C01_079376 [Portunus trituberculatus]|uniref:Uncharacterized protein n=1 Tax=Portunus trituberculatus TaxID=210409 RepID=A0A5B7ILD4_PORTR|nr:hypothetical protein [Portunus trituberculatus]